MRIRFVTGHTPSYKLASVCVPKLEAYCALHDYDLTVQKFPEWGYESTWLKISAVIPYLSDRPDTTVVWLDADCEILDNCRPAEWLSQYEIAFSQDANGLSAGLMALRGADALALMDVVLKAGVLKPEVEARYGAYKAEQNAIKHVLSSYARWKKYHLIPMTVIACPDSGPQPGAWIYHHWGTALAK